MKIEICSYGDWKRNLCFSNQSANVIVSLEVGPRIISYSLVDRDSILKNYPEQIGKSGEGGFQIRGGHRLWTAPEDEKLTYHSDNKPVEHQENPDGSVSFFSKQTKPARIGKELVVRLDEESSRVTVRHTVRNESREDMRISAWGVTVMEPGGLQIIPQPRMRPHPQNLLPNRNLVLWPYTDLSDPRLYFGRKFITLRQDPHGPPIKFGLLHREGWVAYVLGDCLFIKSLSCEEGAEYPDFGCNFETFTNEDMLEIESLSPLAHLASGESISHVEHWNLFPLDEEMQLESEEALTSWLKPFVEKSQEVV